MTPAPVPVTPACLAAAETATAQLRVRRGGRCLGLMAREAP